MTNPDFKIDFNEKYGKYRQRLVIKLKEKDKAFLIHANGECYYLHHLVNNYDSLIIEVKK